MENENQPAQETQEQPTSTQPELTIVDLQNIKAVLDVCARRGAFAAGEMASIGVVYNKLATFLEAVAPQEKSAEDTQASA
jgi:hypothetical protein